MRYNVHATIGKKKGKFIKVKVKRAIEAVKNNLLRQSGTENMNNVKEHNLEGRRIVELKMLAERLWCQSCNRSLSLKDIVEERQCGFASIFKITCMSCGKIIVVEANKKNGRHYDVNKKAALAIIDAGIGERQLNTVCSVMNIPSVSGNLLKRHERAIGPAIEAVAKESCKRSIILEKQLSVNNNRADNVKSDNPVQPNTQSNRSSHPDCKENNSAAGTSETNLIASFDAGWQKRGTGHAYNSLSGHGSLIGFHTGKVLSYSARSKKCRQCEAGHKKEDHDCRCNFSRSAKAMEPDMAVELVTENDLLKNEKAKISVLIGDDDSCTIAAVRRVAGEQIEKWSDFNHALKAFKNALYSIKLQPKLIEYFSNCFSCAVKKNKGNPANVEASLKNVVPHAFGDHNNCGQWCKHKFEGENFVHANLPRGKSLSDSSLRESLLKIFDRFATNAEKLAPCASSQPNESFNNIVASKHPKSKFYAGSESFNLRVAAAVSQKNIGTKYVVNVNELATLSPGKETIKYRESRDKKRETQAKYRKSIDYKRKRLLAKKEKSAKIAATSEREGITYETENGFSNVSGLLQNLLTTGKANLENCSMVVFDLETTGLHKTAEICQIAACTERSSFNVYIIPSKGMTPGATQVTGLEVLHGEMYLRGKRLDTVPSRTAFQNFLHFLQSQGQSLVLIAHNAFRFDAPRILQFATDVGLISEFLSLVKGFADTLHIFREKLPDRKLKKQKFTQEALAKDFLDPSNELQAHNAVNDVQILHKLMLKVSIDRSLISKHTRVVQDVFQSNEIAKKIASNRASLHKFTEISDHMKIKMSKAGINIEILTRAFEAGHDEGVRLLLAEDIGGRPRVTKNKKIIDKIIQGLRTT